MVGPALDCLANPMGAVRILFEKAQAVSAVQNLGSSDWGVRQLFQKFLIEDGGLCQVPDMTVTNLDLLPPKSLVRFRGMVQDMLNQEYYVGAFKDEHGVWRTGKYSDMADVPIGADAQLWERKVLYCVPVPGENAWCREALTPNVTCLSRTLSPPSEERRGKRARDEEAQPSASSDCDAMETDGPESGENKRLRDEGGPSSSEAGGSGSAAMDINIPLEDRSLSPCLVKVYDSMDAGLKLNDIVEFVGMATFDPELTVLSNGNPLSPDAASKSISTSQVPRLQCLYLRKLTPHSPLLPAQTVQAELTAQAAMQEVVAETRQTLLSHLTGLLGGDLLAAEYLLLNMLSRVHARVQPMALGQFSLNVCGLSEAGPGMVNPVTSALVTAMSMLMPRSLCLSLKIEALNAQPFAPHKDYDSDRLITGPLQLAKGTFLTIDETSLQSGQLNNVGIENIHALQSLLQWQKVEYDFRFYKMDMQCDIPVLLLSHGKSMLPASVVLPLRASAEPVHISADETTLKRLRLYLGLVRRLDHSIGEDIAKLLEEDLVAARRDNQAVGQEVFHSWLTMARLMSLSHGETVLTEERWRRVRDMEAVREARLRCC